MRILKIFSMLFIVILVVMLGCSSTGIKTSSNTKSELKNTPTLKVSYQGKNIEAKRGTSSWAVENSDGTKTITNAGSSSPTELVKGSTPITVVPKATLTLDFSDKPNNTIVNIWRGNDSIEQEITDSKVTAPETAGVVIYEVIATWSQGTVTYAFSVKVE